jgi:hypothetical protein
MDKVDGPNHLSLLKGERGSYLALSYRHGVDNCLKKIFSNLWSML